MLPRIGSSLEQIRGALDTRQNNNTHLLERLRRLDPGEVPNFLPEAANIPNRPLMEARVVTDLKSIFRIHMLEKFPHLGRCGVRMSPKFDRGRNRVEMAILERHLDKFYSLARGKGKGDKINE